MRNFFQKEEKMKKKVLAVMLSGAMAAAVLVGCGSSSSTATSTAATSAATTAATEAETTAAAETTQAAASVEEAGGFTEHPIWEGAELGPEGKDPFLTMNGVWFQAVPMSGGYEDIGDNNIHIEADVSAGQLATTLGFGLGDWIPYLQLSYDITDASTGTSVASGNFMPMSASDGPHYGQNISLEAGTYNVTITVSPQEDVYLIHLDSETGPGGTWDDVFPNGQALTYTYEGWNFEGYEQ